jgi:hypothetical protein
VNANASGEALFDHPVRPRSIKVHEAAVTAARELLSEDGLPVTSMDALAARSAALYGLLAEKETR